MANFTDDIPEARRDTLAVSPEPSLAKSSPHVLLWILLAVVALGLAGAGVWWLRFRVPVAETPVEPANGSAVAAEPAEAPAPDTAQLTPEETVAEPDASADAAGEAVAANPSLLGHRRYDIADADGLVEISTNPMVRLQPEAAAKLETMLAEARAVGISLDVISGFRSLEDQQYLFFDLKAERGQTAQTRAEVSAPPGYSEHHTGYAVDFVDLSQPATELSAGFEQTQAFQWLEQNAAFYGFELSFPKENDQNVAYEPWHWRYVGNQESLELFYQD